MCRSGRLSGMFHRARSCWVRPAQGPGLPRTPHTHTPPKGCRRPVPRSCRSSSPPPRCRVSCRDLYPSAWLPASPIHLDIFWMGWLGSEGARAREVPPGLCRSLARSNLLALCRHSHKTWPQVARKGLWPPRHAPPHPDPRPFSPPPPTFPPRPPKPEKRPGVRDGSPWAPRGRMNHQGRGGRGPPA